MDVGDIYYFITSKAVGYKDRPKYHMYICEGDWRDDGDHVFLMINKSNSYGGDGFELRKDDGYPFFPLDVSFVGCTSTVSYTEGFLKDVRGAPVGRLRAEDVAPFLQHAQDCGTLEGWEIIRIVQAFADY